MSDEIKAAIGRLNATWRSGRFDDLREFFHPDVVVVHPRFTKRTTGREALVASYTDFVTHAKIESFEPGEVTADLAGGVTVSVMPWRMKYEFEGNKYDESGWDLLVWNRDGDRWVIVWRTVVLK